VGASKDEPLDVDASLGAASEVGTKSSCSGESEGWRPSESGAEYGF